VLDREKTVVAITANGWTRCATRTSSALRQVHRGALLERDDFSTRSRTGCHLGSRAALPLAQAYDSVATAATSSWAARDQSSTCWWAARSSATTASLRRLSPPRRCSRAWTREQDVQVAGQLRGHAEPPEVMFRKLMSIATTLCTATTSCSPTQPGRIAASARASPAASATHARQDGPGRMWSPIFIRPRTPSAPPRVQPRGAAGRSALGHRNRSAARGRANAGRPARPQLLSKTGLAASVSEATRKIKEGAVEINGAKVAGLVFPDPPSEMIIQVGKKWRRVTVSQ